MANGKIAFLTGISGQDGAYLAKQLLEAGYKVYGGTRRSSVGIMHRLNELKIGDDVEIVDFDLSDQSNITRSIADIKPDYFFNLGAQSFVGSSWNFPVYTSNVDAMGVLHILEALRNHSRDTRFYQASTSEMFGLVQAVPQSEETPFYPRSPYGVAKLFAHWMTKNYRESYDMFAVSGILFNHESPLRGVEFVTRKITLAFAKIVAGQQDFVALGNLDAKRDWGYADEYVSGMHKMLTADTPDDFVLATGVTTTIRDFVNLTAEAAGMELEWDGKGLDETARNKANGQVVVKIDPGFFRPAEVDLLIGDAKKAESQLGWKANTTVGELAKMMFEADYNRVKAGAIYF